MHTHMHRSRWDCWLHHHLWLIINTELKWADRRFDNVTSQRWRDAVPVWKPAPRQSASYFSACFFQWKYYFFLRWDLMLWPYAGSCREDNRPQCADRPRLPPPSHPFPSNSLPYRATNRPLWEPSTAPTTRAVLKHPPTSIPARDTFRSNPPHTAPLCALNLPPKTGFPCCLAEAWCAELDCLIYYTTYW